MTTQSDAVAAYLSEIELALVSTPLFIKYTIVRMWLRTDEGYIRVRARLVNGDFLETAEYFVLSGDRVVTEDYRHQWMDGDKITLYRRWDSTPDHPHLPNFPYHVHIGDEVNVQPDRPRSLLETLAWLERKLMGEGDAEEFN